ncbi:MAG: type IV pilus assembly protein PilM [Candidatus Sumerlaeia bacterium]|nr:type IV pilus assembly protein PilM [Candidatus Sumerlaeia bacterium]
MFGKKSVVGLDIGSSKVKAIQLRRAGNRLEVERFGVADVFSPDRPQGASVSDLKLTAAREAVASGRLDAKYSVSAVAGESIIVRYIQMIEMPEAELKNALRWEAEEYLPFAIDEVNIDSVVLGPSASPGKVDVLLVCARKDMITEHYNIIRSVGLTPLVVDVEGFAFLNCFEAIYKPGPQDCVALVNIGAETTNINIYVGGTSRFSRDIPIAGNAITSAVMNKASVDFAKAEEVKRIVGAPSSEAKADDGEGESSLISTIRGSVERITGSDLGDNSVEANAEKAIAQTLEQFVGELRRSVQFFENQPGGKTVSRVFVGGGSAKMKNLTDYVASGLDIPVEIMDPLRGLSVGSGVNRDLIEAHREQLAVCVGLALRNLD